MSRKITIEHEGKTYYGHLAIIESTMLGYEDHGIFTAYLMCKWGANRIGVGGYGLDERVPGASDGRRRVGTAYGMDHMMALMHVVGVNRWEDLPGKSVIVLFETVNSLGSRAVGIAAAHEDRVLILADHAEAWRSRE